jgi:hypothetical protein
MPRSPRSPEKLTATSSTGACRLEDAAQHAADAPGPLLEHQEIVGAEEGHRGRQCEAGHDRFDAEGGIVDRLRSGRRGGEEQGDGDEPAEPLRPGHAGANALRRSGIR